MALAVVLKIKKGAVDTPKGGLLGMLYHYVTEIPQINQCANMHLAQQTIQPVYIHEHKHAFSSTNRTASVYMNTGLLTSAY